MPDEGDVQRIPCPTCDMLVRAIYNNGVWRLPSHANRAGNACPTRRKPG